MLASESAKLTVYIYFSYVFIYTEFFVLNNVLYNFNLLVLKCQRSIDQVRVCVCVCEACPTFV